jgi:hypothetical protein
MNPGNEIHNTVRVISGSNSFVVAEVRAGWNGACSCLKPAALFISDFYLSWTQDKIL